MLSLSREEGKGNEAKSRKEEKPFSAVVREYFSLNNRNIFLFMILSVIPAAICQAIYMSLGILDIKGKIDTLFFDFYYTPTINTGYDFIIQPITVIATLNLGLLAIRIIGWGLANEEGEVEKGSDIDKYVIPLFIIIFVSLFLYKVPFLKWTFPLAFLFLYLITRTCSKIVIFLTLVFFNVAFLARYYELFEFAVILNGEISNIFTFMAKIGFSWLYILPYNFLFFFPFIITIYFWDFKHPEKYISSFFDVVFHENMVAVFVGLFLNVMFSAVPIFVVLSQPELPILRPLPFLDPSGIIIWFHEILGKEITSGLSTLEVLTIMHLWVGSFILWFTPFFVSLAQLETKFEANFDRKLRDIIQRMKDHIVMVGFGNLGKKVCSDLIKRGVISLKSDTIEIFTPDLDVKKICKKLLVIDINDQLFDRVHTDPILQNVGVARSTMRIEGEKKDILIPAIIGDINSETTKESSQLRNSKFFISAPSDYRATFTLSKFANAEDLDSIISVEDSAQRDYFSPKMTAHDTFFIYPAFQEGISLGRVASLCYLRLREELEAKKPLENIEIVIAGEGKQIHYLMETFWMETERAGTFSDSQNQGMYKLPISILTNSEEITKRSISKKSDKYDKIMKLQEIIKRSACKDQNDAYLSVDVIVDYSDRLKTIEKIIEDKEPQIIVITSDTIQKVSKIFHEWFLGAERYISAGKKNYKPTMIVGVLGDEYEEIQDILLYYTQMEPPSKIKFPIQYIDAAVRAYDDSKEQIGGLAQSFTRKGNLEYRNKKIREIIGEIKEPLALYCCIDDLPGSLGSLLGKLAGVEFTDVKSVATREAISLHYCRFQSCSGVENYSFLANAELHEKKSINEKENLFFCLFQSESEEPERRELTRKSIKHLLNIKDITEELQRDPDLLRLYDICSCCSRRITCFVASYLRKVKNLINNEDYYKNLETLEKIPEGTVDRELKRFFMNSQFQKLDIGIKSDLPKAAILVCCRHSKITGSVSTAVNNLSFRKVDKIHGEKIADITYLRSYECYDPALTNIEFYGNLVEDVQNDHRERLKKEGVIDGVFINAVTKKNQWYNYAKSLCEVLNKIYEDNYELWVDKWVTNQINDDGTENTPDNVAVIRKGFVKGNSSEVDVNCKKQDCIIHNKIKLLKKKWVWDKEKKFLSLVP